MTQIMERQAALMPWKLNIVNMIILSRVICIFNEIPIKNSYIYFSEIEKIIHIKNIYNSTTTTTKNPIKK